MNLFAELMEQAGQARLAAYAPYSHFQVGAAVLGTDGRIYTGCNVENASYPLGNCAERTAIFKAVSEGCRSFEAIAICGAPEGEAPVAPCAPCGACRQVMAEFCRGNFIIVLQDGKGGLEFRTLDELLPCRFGPDNL